MAKKSTRSRGGGGVFGRPEVRRCGLWPNHCCRYRYRKRSVGREKDLAISIYIHGCGYADLLSLWYFVKSFFVNIIVAVLF